MGVFTHRSMHPTIDAVTGRETDRLDGGDVIRLHALLALSSLVKEAGQRIRATQSLMRSQGMTSEAGENHRDLLTRLSTALAMTEVAYLEAWRRREL